MILRWVGDVKRGRRKWECGMDDRRPTTDDRRPLTDQRQQMDGGWRKV
jgi:hypothetical protein